MSESVLAKFVEQRQTFYGQRLDYCKKVAAFWRGYKVASSEELCTMFQMINDRNFDLIGKCESDFNETGSINFKDLHNNYKLKTLPEKISKEKAEEYLNAMFQKLARNAELKSIHQDILLMGWQSINPSDPETLKEIDILRNLDPNLSMTLEWRLFSRERIFSKYYKYADGEAKPMGKDNQLMSGVFHVFNTVESVQLCKVSQQFFETLPIVSFEDFKPAPESDELTAFTFGSDASTQPDESRSNSGVANKDPLYLEEFMSQLSVANLMDFKHRQLMSSTSSQKVTVGATHSDLSMVSGPEHMSNATSCISTASSMDDPNVEHAIGRKSRSFSKTERKPTSSSSWSDLGEPSVIETPNKAVEVDSHEIYKSATADDWEPYFRMFLEKTELTDLKRKEATNTAAKLNPRLIMFYKGSHEFTHANFLKRLNLAALTDWECLFFLFLSTHLRDNADLSAIVYQIINNAMQ